MTPDRFFFVHLMKTGGTTFRQHVLANFGPGERYPDDQEDDDLLMAKLSVPTLLDLPEARRDRIRMYTGHFPYCAAEMLAVPLTTLTILRDPVERTLSHLKQEQALDRAGRSLEALYDDPEVRNRIGDHQVRMFAFAPEDDMENFADPLVIDDERLARACRNVDGVDVIGRQDRFEAFVDAVVDRFGWVRAPVRAVRVGPDVDVPAALRRRISADAEAEQTFFEHAARRAV